MIKQVVLALLIWASPSFASNYFVDCNYGSNGNPGTSQQQAWRTLLEVGISSFQPGDTINLRRDCTWFETLTPPSSGSSGSLIKIDSYGNGLPHISPGICRSVCNGGPKWEVRMCGPQPCFRQPVGSRVSCNAAFVDFIV
jgi:hypothetical protein